MRLRVYAGEVKATVALLFVMGVADNKKQRLLESLKAPYHEKKRFLLWILGIWCKIKAVKILLLSTFASQKHY